MPSAQATPKRIVRTKIAKALNEVRDRIVLAHLSLVKAIAIRIHETLPVHVDLGDLEHAGILGLFDAASKYKPEMKVVFHSYAKHRIKGAILDSLRQLDWASRDLRKRHKQVEAATRDLSTKLEREPSEAEIAEKLGVGLDRWRLMLLELRTVGLVSATRAGPQQEAGAEMDFPAKPDSQPDTICGKWQLEGMLEKAMRVLPDRYRKVVVLYYNQDKTMKEIGSILGINESRVSQIHKTALEKMAAALHIAGIHSVEAF